jgi:hypothetical protein
VLICWEIMKYELEARDKELRLVPENQRERDLLIELERELDSRFSRTRYVLRPSYSDGMGNLSFNVIELTPKQSMSIMARR